MVAQSIFSIYNIGDFTVRVYDDPITNNRGTTDYDCLLILNQQPRPNTFYNCYFIGGYGFEADYLEWTDEEREYWSYDQTYMMYTAYGLFQNNGVQDFHGFSTHQPAFRFTISLHEPARHFSFERFFERVLCNRVETTDTPLTALTHSETIYFVNPHKTSVSSNNIHILRDI